MTLRTIQSDGSTSSWQGHLMIFFYNTATPVPHPLHLSSLIKSLQDGNTLVLRQQSLSPPVSAGSIFVCSIFVFILARAEIWLRTPPVPFLRVPRLKEQSSSLHLRQLFVHRDSSPPQHPISCYLMCSNSDQIYHLANSPPLRHNSDSSPCRPQWAICHRQPSAGCDPAAM